MLVLSHPVHAKESRRGPRENITKDEEDSSYWHPVTVPWFNINCTKRSPLIGKYEILSGRGRVPFHRAAQARARGCVCCLAFSGGCKTYMYIPYTRHVPYPKRKCFWVRSAGYLSLWELEDDPIAVRLLFCVGHIVWILFACAYLTRDCLVRLDEQYRPRRKCSARQSIKSSSSDLKFEKTRMKMERNTYTRKVSFGLSVSASNILLAGALWSFITFLQAITLASRWRCFGDDLISASSDDRLQILSCLETARALIPRRA